MCRRWAIRRQSKENRTRRRPTGAPRYDPKRSNGARVSTPVGLRPRAVLGTMGEAKMAVGGGRNKRAGAQAQQIVLAHQPQHALGVDDLPLAPQLRGDPAIAVMAMLETDAAEWQSRKSSSSRWGSGVGFKMPIIAGARNAAQATNPNLCFPLRPPLAVQPSNSQPTISAAPFGKAACVGCPYIGP